MKKTIEVPKGNDLVGLPVSGHSYVRVLDAAEREVFRFDSPGEHVTAVLAPGTYTVETDGKVGKIEFGAARRLLEMRELDALKPPR
jgi:hypothetical protein